MLLEVFSYPLRRRHVINPLSPGVLRVRDVVNSLVPGRSVLGRVCLGGGDVVDLEHKQKRENISMVKMWRTFLMFLGHLKSFKVPLQRTGRVLDPNGACDRKCTRTPCWALLGGTSYRSCWLCWPGL